MVTCPHPCLGPRLAGGEDASLARGLIIAFESGRQRCSYQASGSSPASWQAVEQPQGEGYILSPVTTMWCLSDVQDAINRMMRC